MPSPITLPAWQALVVHHFELLHTHLRTFFDQDPDRFSKFSVAFGDLLVDFSKQRIVGKTLDLLLKLAEQAGLADKISAMFAGERINVTEYRAVLHVALRNRSNRSVFLGNQDVMLKVNAVLAKMRDFTSRVHTGEWRGSTGKRIIDVVNLGIGGSELGSRMVVQALAHYHIPGLRVHFVSSVDATQLLAALKGLSPETTLFIVASKSFTTQETMINAALAKTWLLKQLRDSDAMARHFIAISANAPACVAFGILPENIFTLWDWVGGRYSLWSAIGLPIALAIGMERFEELLAGAHALDEHFRTTPLCRNLPVLLGLLGIWNVDCCGWPTQAILPYDQYLACFPAYIQQLDMESNGKRVTKMGEPVVFHTSPIVWGKSGIDGQHTFFQLLHQGTHIVPIDFIVTVRPLIPVGSHHTMLLANCLAQSESLMQGKSLEKAQAELKSTGRSLEAIDALAPHKVSEGNRPSTTILIKELTPVSLGSLIALYEHKVFVQGAIWDINSFDQMGVECGKQLAKTIFLEFESDITNFHDASTTALIAICKQWRLEE